MVGLAAPVMAEFEYSFLYVYQIFILCSTKPLDSESKNFRLHPFFSSSTRVQQDVGIIIILHSIYINGKNYLPMLAGGQNHAHM